ncbi:MAG: hypothetical protein D6824_00185 [Planctomycetota bacterium]|nr:MAG: hypothetical protein D6824_00185 [Planctomycetota bacterium]
MTGRNGSCVWTMLSLAAAALWLTASAARAQEAPAGNAQPRLQLVADEALPNPFAPETAAAQRPSVDAAEKLAFASRLKLQPLRSLAVSNGGRVKILDTLARESVRFLTGRKNFLAYLPAEDGGVRKAKFDPLFTFLDLMIDPRFYDDKPLVHVEFLPLRRALLAAQGLSPQEQERWLKLTRLSPAMIASSFAAVAQERATSPGFGKALERTQQQMSLLSHAHRTLLLVAPDDDASPWLHVSSSKTPGEVKEAFGKLGAAWRARDATAANEAIERIAALLPAINASRYPGVVRQVEAAYNRYAPFDWGAWLYGAAFLLLVLAFGIGRRRLVWSGTGALALAIMLHAAGFFARWVIAQRLPIQNQFESLTGLSLAASAFGFGIMLRTRQWLFGAAAAGAGFLMLLVATTTGVPGETITREAAILNTSVLLKYHVTSVLTSYGLITLGFILSCFYLWTYYGVRFKGAKAAALAAEGLNLPDRHGAHGSQRTLHDLDRAQTTVLQLAFWILGVGILLGAWWADHSWGRWWAFDPKETWALVTWIVYLIVVHVRFTAGPKRGLLTAWLSVVGFFVMLWTYFGVNLLLPGLHAYA